MSSYDVLRQGLSAPVCLTWEMTYACNLLCVHCLSSSGRRAPDELTTGEAKALLDENPNPTEDDIRWAISGNVCRCTGYMNIVKAVQWAASKQAEAGPAATS